MAIFKSDYKEWIILTILLVLVVGAGLLICGTLMEINRLSQLLDVTSDQLKFLWVAILGISFIFVAYLAQVYLLLNGQIALSKIGHGQKEPVYV